MTQTKSVRSLLAVLGIGALIGAQALAALTTDQLTGIRSKLDSSKKQKKTAPASKDRSMALRLKTMVTGAKNLLGRPYDQTMGTDGGKRYAAGQIVCVDIPRLAYLDAGISMAKILLADAQRFPWRYPKETDNFPDHPIFARRTRNWVRWCQGNGRFLPPTATPKVGDVVFFGTIHIALVTGVDKDGGYTVVETAPSTGKALEQTDWMLKLRGWKPTGFGRILPLPAQYAGLLDTPKMVVAKKVDPTCTVEYLKQEHPGLTMLSNVLAKLQGKKATVRLVKNGPNGRVVTRPLDPAVAMKEAEGLKIEKPAIVEKKDIEIALPKPAPAAPRKTEVAINAPKAAAPLPMQDLPALDETEAIPAEEKPYLKDEEPVEQPAVAVAVQKLAAVKKPAPAKKKPAVAAKPAPKSKAKYAPITIAEVKASFKPKKKPAVKKVNRAD